MVVFGSCGVTWFLVVGGAFNFAAGDEVTIPWPFQLLLSQLELDDDGSDVDILGRGGT